MLFFSCAVTISTCCIIVYIVTIYLFVVKILLHTIMDNIFDLYVVYFWQIISGIPYMIFKGIPIVIGYYVNVHKTGFRHYCV